LCLEHLGLVESAGVLAVTPSLSRLVEHVLRRSGSDHLLGDDNSFTYVVSLDDYGLSLKFSPSLRMTGVRSPFAQRSGSELHTHLPFSAPQLLLHILPTDFMTSKIVRHLFLRLLILVKVMDHITSCTSSIIQRIIFSSSFIPNR